MHPSPAKPHFRLAPALRWAAATCALLVWVLGMLAFSPDIHGSMHAGAAHQDHACAVTLFSHGVEDPTGSVLLACAPALFSAGTCDVPATVPTDEDPYRLPPGCGPPVG